MYLFGASGHGKVIKEIIEATGDKVDAFVDDNLMLDELAGTKVLHGETELSPMIVSIGVNAIRKKIVEKLHCEFGIAIHPSAVISPSAKIGDKLLPDIVCRDAGSAENSFRVKLRVCPCDVSALQIAVEIAVAVKTSCRGKAYTRERLYAAFGFDIEDFFAPPKFFSMSSVT